MGDSSSSPSSSSASYIHMVQHLIEKCLLFDMTKEECMEALSKHANIKSIITSTVWKELEKENKEFFETYSRNQRDIGGNVMSEKETTQRILKVLRGSSSPGRRSSGTEGSQHNNKDDDDK